MENENVSINKNISDENKDELGDLIMDKKTPSPEEIAVNNILKFYITELLENSNLTKREIEIIKLRFGLNGNNTMTLKEISKIYHVTKECIRQIEKKVLQKLRPRAIKMGLGEYIDIPSKTLKKETTNNQEITQKIPKQTEVQQKTTEQKSPNTQKEKITKEEQQKILNILKHPLFRETLENSLTYEELALFQIQVEYAVKKNLSVENLASFLQIKEEKIWNTNRKALLLCKEKVNTYLDSMIKLTTNPIKNQEVHSKLKKE